MAASGAKILHLRCVEYARRYHIPVHVRSSFYKHKERWSWQHQRPEHRQEGPWKQAIIAGVAHDRSEAKITVVGVPDKVGEAARIFDALADARSTSTWSSRTSPPRPPASPTSPSRCRARTVRPR